MRTADFYDELPPELIAQAPAGENDAGRMMVLNREAHSLPTETSGIWQSFCGGVICLTARSSTTRPAKNVRSMRHSFLDATA
jgi:S-adenosylmethionine:tRNA-ribosyltransferase-isomerase (queuine synthetase)